MCFQYLEVVQHEYRDTTRPQGLCLGQGRRPFGSVVVAPHCRDRGYLGEFAENTPVSDVTRMNDVIAAAQEALASGRSRPWVSEINPIRSINVGYR